MTWVAVVLSAAAVLLQKLLPANLDSDGRLFLFASYVAFMARTFTFHAGLALGVEAMVIEEV